MAYLNDTGVVVAPKARLNYFKDRVGSLNAAAPRGAIPTAQQLQDASGVVAKGAVGQDSPVIRQSKQMAQQFAPMMNGQQVKDTSQQMAGKYASMLSPRANATGTTAKIDPESSTDGIDAILGSMYTSPEQEEKMRRASIANRRILAVGDALRQIGNIYHTVKGAPSQTFNSPVDNERRSYLQDRSVRDAANMKYLSYRQAKAAQDAKQKQWEATFNYNAARDAARLKSQQDYQNATLKQRGDQFAQNYALNVRKADDQAKDRDRKYEEARRHNLRSEGLRGAGIQLQQKKFEWQKQNGGRSGQPYVLPTKNGYISLGRDLNSNAIGKKGLYTELKNGGYLSQSDLNALESYYVTPEQKSAILNTGISKWLMNDNNAETYMKEHFGASSVSNVNNEWDDYLDEDDDDPWSQYED